MSIQKIPKNSPKVETPSQGAKSVNDSQKSFGVKQTPNAFLGTLPGKPKPPKK